MFTGSISYEGDRAPPRHTIDMAVQCALQLRNQKTALTAPRLIKSFDLADGTQAYVLDMEHVWRVHLIPPAEGFEEEAYEVRTPSFPMHQTATIAGMLSGNMNLVTLEHRPDRDPPGLYIKNDNFNLMPESSELFARPEASYKLAIEENDALAPLRDPFSPIIYSQFASIEPGNYTGAMSHIIQLLLGVGRILPYDYEQRWLDADPNRSPMAAKTVDLDPITGELENDTEGPPTSFYIGQDNEQVQITYDWRWNRTHGVMWGARSQGRQAPMLVELGQRGIFLMPFPVDSISQTPAGQAHYLKVYPDLGRFSPFKDGEEPLFEAIGGFPTGERMPGVIEETRRWVRAGFLLEADRDLSEFYSGIAMTSNFGWSFHPSKPRAINTMYKYNDKGQKVGYCYEVNLAITEKADVIKVRNTVTPLVIAALGLTDEIDKFKAERLPQDFAEAMVESPDYDEFDAFEVSPDWDVRARIIKLREGFLEFPGFQCPKGSWGPCHPLTSAPHFKYYEPIISSVLNFDFEKPPDVPMPARSDGPIFATYVNGSAEIVHFFHEPGTGTRFRQNTRQPCQYVGIWQDIDYSEGMRLVGHFYTSSRDFRHMLNTGGGSVHTTAGEIVGDYDFLGFCAYFARHGEVTKRWVGDETRETRSWNSRGFKVAISCASNNRSMFFACAETSERDRGKSGSYSGSLGIGTSGAHLKASIYNFIFYWTWVCLTPDHPPHGNPACVMTFSEPIVHNPFACMGVDPPGEFTYAVCCVNGGVIGGCYANSELVVISPRSSGEDKGIIYGAAVTRGPTLPPRHSWSEPTTHWGRYEVWAFGHPLLHNRMIKEDELETTDGTQMLWSLSNEEWWTCSIPFECPAYPWRVAANYYGPPYVGTFRDQGGFGWIELGLKPSVGAGRPFGVVY
jgi:hypothetical protein